MRSVTQGQHLFSQVPQVEIPRSTFDRSHGHKTTFNAGYLIPVLVDEALPGDTFNLDMTAFARMATPIFPVMDNIFMDTHFFAVPLRLVWTNFKKMMGEQVNPGDSTSYVCPTSTAPGAGGYAVGSLQDYMGIPTGINSLQHNNLFCRAYNLIWNEWFRDENLQNSVTVDTGDGPDTSTNYVVLQRGKRHDYFTSCLPWPQKSSSGVAMPLGTQAIVKTNLTDLLTSGTNTALHFRLTSNNAIPGSTNLLNVETTAGGLGFSTTTGAISGQQIYPANLFADMTNTGATINQLREAFQIQKLLERDARGGTRYTELIRAHFGVTSPDARLQRSEYLGGGSSPINVNQVAQTSATNAQPTPIGTLSAFATATLTKHGFTKSFTEHCIIIGLVSVRADLNYQQGLNKMFKRSTRYDFYWPALAQIGEQAVLRGEIYADGTSNDNIVFGYQERYAEYRYKPSITTGLMRSTAAGTLHAWHLAQQFSSPPALNSAFIVENPPFSRIMSVPTQPHFIFDSFFKYRCARPMPVYGVPGLLDHF